MASFVSSSYQVIANKPSAEKKIAAYMSRITASRKWNEPKAIKTLTLEASDGCITAGLP
jgi:hypothetical protein